MRLGVCDCFGEMSALETGRVWNNTIVSSVRRNPKESTRPPFGGRAIFSRARKFAKTGLGHAEGQAD
jgi:hypothetical protein